MLAEGLRLSVSLRELRHLCEAEGGHAIEITPVPATSHVDLRILCDGLPERATGTLPASPRYAERLDVPGDGGQLS